MFRGGDRRHRLPHAAIRISDRRAAELWAMKTEPRTKEGVPDNPRWTPDRVWLSLTCSRWVDRQGRSVKGGRTTAKSEGQPTNAFYNRSTANPDHHLQRARPGLSFRGSATRRFPLGQCCELKHRATDGAQSPCLVAGISRSGAPVRGFPSAKHLHWHWHWHWHGTSNGRTPPILTFHHSLPYRAIFIAVLPSYLRYCARRRNLHNFSRLNLLNASHNCLTAARSVGVRNS
jgi:hypothetical protein